MESLYKHFILVDNGLVVKAWSNAFNHHEEGIELESDTILHSSAYPFGGRHFSPALMEDGIFLYGYANGKVTLRNINAEKLEKAKAKKLQSIDARTERLCESGITTQYGSFNTRKIDQQNWLTLVVMVDALSFPIPVSTSDGRRYEIPDKQTLLNIFQLSLQWISSVRDAGRTLRLSALSAATMAALDAVVDDRE